MSSESITEDVATWDADARRYPPYILNKENWWVPVITDSGEEVLVPYTDHINAFSPEDFQVRYIHDSEWNCSVGSLVRK